MLAKQTENVQALQKKVSTLAAKSQYGHVQLVPSAEKLAYNNLMGMFVPMDGRLPIEGGTLCKTKDGRKGWVFDEPSEIGMLRNWGDGIFQESEIAAGREFRKIDSDIDLDTLCKAIADDLAHLPKFKSLDELIHWIDNVHFHQLDPELLLLSVADFILRPEHIQPMLLRWVVQGRPSLEKFAPYAFYFYKANLFYILGIYFKLIKLQT